MPSTATAAEYEALLADLARREARQVKAVQARRAARQARIAERNAK